MRRTENEYADMCLAGLLKLFTIYYMGFNVISSFGGLYRNLYIKQLTGTIPTELGAITLMREW